VNVYETIKVALSAIWAHKLRSFLTLLGMIIGVTAVVVIVALIQGFNAYVDEKIANIGAKSYSIYRFDFFKDFRDTDTLAAAQRRNPELTLEDYEYLRARLQLTEQLGARVAPTNSQVKRGTQTLDSVPVWGTTPNIVEIEKTDIADGRYFTEGENEVAARVCFIGADIAEKLFPYEPAVGGEIYIRGIPFRVVGVQARYGYVFGRPPVDSSITIPIRTYIRTFGPPVRNRWLYFIGKAVSDELFNDAVEEARAALRLRRGLRADEEDNFGIVTPDVIMGARDRIFGPIFIVAIAVPSIALVVGGIVIMNIMLVSVTERTKEIGIRKAVGARRRDILKQFLVEAVTLSAIGGAIGVLLAWLLSQIVSLYVFQTRLSLLAISIAIFVSGGIGVMAGIFPAWRAARLDPIESLRAD
jgi:putative ABC transport system permease protein